MPNDPSKNRPHWTHSSIGNIVIDKNNCIRLNPEKVFFKLGGYAVNDNTLAYWPLNGNGYDYLRNWDAKSYSGITWSDGIINSCASFKKTDNSSIFISDTDDMILFPYINYMSAWIYKTTAATSDEIIFCKYYRLYNGVDEAPVHQFKLFIDSNNKLHYISAYENITHTDQVPLNQWVHVAHSHSSSPPENDSRIFMNGVPVQKPYGFSGYDNTLSLPLFIGASGENFITTSYPPILNANKAENYFNGKIDEVFVEDISWSNEKVLNYYNQYNNI